MNEKTIKVFIISFRIMLGTLFIYGGIQKFTPKPPTVESAITENLPPHVVKIKAYIGGLKQTGYFWPMLGVAEIVAGILLISQYLSLLGAIILIPITLNIFLFHAFLEPHDTQEFIMTGLYLIINILIILYHYKQLKPVFLNFKSLP